MSPDFSDERHRMVETQIRRRGLRDERLLAAFEAVPRHLFVPEEVRRAAYDDMPLSIGHGQTISQPYIVALMISLLQLQGDERVLEVGTGSGYQAAILSHMTAQVETVELVPELGEVAERLLQALGYSNVHVHVGDGSLGWPISAPYPAIIAAAAAPEVPKPLLEELSEGGRLVLPVEANHEQLLKVYTRQHGAYPERIITAVAFVPMKGRYGWA